MRTEVNPLVVYSTYMAIKLHFENGSYDAFKFQFKGPQRKLAAFLKSNDRFTYEKIARKYPHFQNLIDFLLANALDGRKWIRDMDDEVYQMWTAKIQRMTYQFNNDMTRMADYALDNKLTFDDCLKPNASTDRVPILDLFAKGAISAESVITIDVLVDFLKHINKKAMADPLGILSDKVYMLKQYKPFIIQKINVAASKNTIINLFS